MKSGWRVWWRLSAPPLSDMGVTDNESIERIERVLMSVMRHLKR